MPLPPDRGGIAGLVIDDVYRPVPGALVLIEGHGLTATTDAQGVFRFTDLAPGSYIALANAQGHEAAPVNIDVEAGLYADAEIVARRVFSQDGTLITTSYSIFTACGTSAFLVSTVASCILDEDSYRPGLHLKSFTQSNITYMVAEVRMNQPDNYIFVARCSDDGSFGCGEYAYTNISQAESAQQGVYGRLVLKLGDNYMRTWQSQVWNNTDPMDILVFYKGQGYETIHPAAYPVGCMLPPVTNPLNGKPAFCREYYGVGARVALQGRIIMSLFLGEPRKPIDGYHALSPPTA